MANGLPAGFVLDQPIAPAQPAGLPAGFVPDAPMTGTQQDVLGIGPAEPFFANLQELATGAQRQTTETATLPELFGSFEGGGRDLTEPEQRTMMQIAAGFLSTTDDTERVNIIKQALPDAEVRQDEKGNQIVKVEGKEFLINRPGFSTSDALTATAQLISFVGAGKFTGLVKSLGAKFGIGALTAGATEAGLETVADVAGGGAGLSPAKIGTAAALGGAAELAAPAAKGLMEFGADIGTAVKTGKPLGQVTQARKAITSLPAEEATIATQATREAQAASEATGVPLFQAQQTTIPSQLEKQSFIAQLPAGTQKASTALKAQNEAAGTAVDDLLAAIAPDESIITGVEKFRTASQRAIQATKDIRAEKTSKFFDDAFLEGADVDLKPVRDFIKSATKESATGGEVEKSLRKVMGFIEPSDVKQGLTKVKGKTSLRKLHNAKLEIDEMLTKVGGGALGNTAKRRLTEAKNILRSQMQVASPLYKKALDEFATASPPVTRIQESIIGKIATFDNTRLKLISGRIFDAAETNPQVIKNAKKVIDDVDPEAWNQLLRTELERRLGSVRTVEGLSAENVPAQLFNAMFGNTKQRAVLFNSVDGETAKNLKFLETVLSRAKLGRPGGSQTAAREEIKRELRGGTASIRDFFRKPVDGLLSTGEDAAFNARVKSLADAMFDPQFKPRMKELRAAGVSSPQSKKLMDSLLKDVEATLKAAPQIVEPETVQAAKEDIAALL